MNEAWYPQQVSLPEICGINAVPLARMIRERKLSAAEVMSAYLDHIEAVNPVCNAIVSLRPREELMAEARAADAAVARGEAVGPLHGLPQAIKDLALTRGLRTTYGSPLFADLVPETDSIFVARMRAAGAIIIGKTNVPEFGYGSNTYNPIFGVTRNAYDPSRIGGGSSGSAAVALALRMLPVADGSDMGGSLRNPAAFNNVFGFRPSQGRVPSEGLDPFYGQLSTDGPMGRTIEDVAMLLTVQSGHDRRAPLSLEAPDFRFEDALSADPRTLRFGWLGDLGGHLPFEPGVLELCAGACDVLAGTGASVEPTKVDFDPERLWRAFVTLRQQSIGGRHDAAYRDPRTRALLKPEAIWEIEQSHRLTGLDIYEAGIARGAWYKAFTALFERFDFLLIPSAQVFPFSADLHWPKEINGRAMDSYHRWMEVVAGATMAGLPSISVPAGFSADGLPMGMQIIGPPRGDREVLRAAAAYEAACPWIGRLPRVFR
ncbi:amidase [Roseomonas xinghualingensis]|uniref:amidase n=1 Tax=Roseomonas xinghualingensis TaxID=2986475 RepID=UPI0021F1EF41|nr:amidase [Roseomonas sp. SXEYE001]MCV4208567.1 amidase [Roseomonas sp. SXEYE001]